MILTSPNVRGISFQWKLMIVWNPYLSELPLAIKIPNRMFIHYKMK